MKKKHTEPLPSASHDAEPSLPKAGTTSTTALPDSDTNSESVSSTGKQHNGRLLGMGDLLDNRFKLVEILDSEGISIVYQAIDKSKPVVDKECYVTIKVLKSQFLSTIECVDAFAQAALKCQNLDHPNIAKVYGFHSDQSTAYLHMEYMPGESLGHKIRWGVKRIPVKQAVQIVNRIGRALAYAHERGVVHNDLKPANVFLTDSNEVKVIDFGIAQAIRRTAKDDTDLTHYRPDNYSVLSPSYASPDLLDLKEPDPRDDVYALACIAYELLAGRHPFGRVRATGARDHGFELRPSEAFTRSQWSSLQKALAFDRDVRTPTVQGFINNFNTSTKLTHGISLAAGVVIFCVAVGLLIYNQMPVEEISVAPEMVKTPSLLEESDPSQLVSSRVSEIGTNTRVDVSIEEHPANNDRTVAEQIIIPSEKVDTTKEITQLTEQASLTHELSSPVQDDSPSSTSIKPRPDVETAKSAVIDISSSETDAPIQLQPTTTTPHQIELASIDDEAEDDISSADSITDTHGSDTDKLEQEQPITTTSNQFDLDTPVDIEAEPEIQSQSIADPRDSDSIEPTQVQSTIATSDHVKLDSAADAKDDSSGQLPESVVTKSVSDTVEPTLAQRAVTASAEREVDLLPEVEDEPDIQTTALSLGTSTDIDESTPVQPLLTTTQTTARVKPTVVINEFMAINRQTVTDAQGDYDDWIELYNWSLEAIDLSGFYLSDNPKNLKQWRFPKGTEISATSYLIIWADRASSDPDSQAQPPELHANFELSDRGEQILLVDSDENGNSIIDSISFGRQHEDSSIGRSPNGFGRFGRTYTPTPGWANSMLR